MSSDFSGKAVLVAGGTGGLGRAVSLAFLQIGAQVAAVAPVLIARKFGAIVNVAAKAAWDHAAGASAYSATKAAALALMDSLAAELLGAGVRVNSILPSITDTAANRAAMPGADFSKWPKSEDIAKVVLFFASDDARVIHLASIPVFGNG